MIINFLSLDLIAFEQIIIIGLLFYIAWQTTPKKGGNKWNSKD